MDRTSVVFAHYHTSGSVSENLVNLVEEFSKRVDQVVFVSTKLTETYQEILGSFAKVIVRENFGYDFWSYKVGLDSIIDLSNHDRVIIANSSIVTLYPEIIVDKFLGPVGSPKLRGITISHQLTRHIQSYWVSFEGKALIGSPDFAEWWGRMVPISDREQVIHQYELGMSQFFSARNWPLTAELEPDRSQQLVMLARAIAVGVLQFEVTGNSVGLNLDDFPLNPTHFLWDALLERAGMIKIELLRDNPERQSMDVMRSWLADKAHFRALIDDALA